VKKSPKPATKKARRKAVVKRLARPPRAHKKHPIENLLNRIDRKASRRIDELVAGVTAPLTGMLEQAEKELGELDAALGDDEE
jgi:hypothetical protein